MCQFDKSLVWFRRDLRTFDHAALYHALKTSRTVYCVFVFDTEILDSLPRYDRRVEFIHGSVTEVTADLHRMGGSLLVVHGHAKDLIPEIADKLGVDAVFANHDYEPQALVRDKHVAKDLRAKQRKFLTSKDHVIFECDEIKTKTGTSFSVFTPYKNAWLRKVKEENGDFYLKSYPVEQYKAAFAIPACADDYPLPSLAQLGFEKTNLLELGFVPGMSGGEKMLEDFLPKMPDYQAKRDFPASNGTSHLSVHLRFGTISIRSLARQAIQTMHIPSESEGGLTWLSELIWRDFYGMILYNHPHVVEHAFKPEYDAIRWESGPAAKEVFQAWCEGETGYPLIDAGMAQLNQTGFMHNRLRMVTASFLIKDLGIDWRWGERYFAEKLNDYDLASNNGGWQWAASSGCDAQPYFRIFNPITQSEKFDPEGSFIRRYLPQLSRVPNKNIHAPWLMTSQALQDAGLRLGIDYPEPIVSHEIARQETLTRYAVVKTVT